MTRYLLDTNIISNVLKSEPSPALLAWMEVRDTRDLFIAAFTLGEIHRGILQKPNGKRRDTLAEWFAGPAGPSQLFAGRILPFDAPAALVWAELMAEGKTRGQPRDAVDTMIAAVAITNQCVVVTDNEKDFAGIALFNPMRGDRPSPRAG